MAAHFGVPFDDLVGVFKTPRGLEFGPSFTAALTSSRHRDLQLFSDGKTSMLSEAVINKSKLRSL